MFSLRYGQDEKFANNVNIGSTSILLLKHLDISTKEQNIFLLLGMFVASKSQLILF